MRTILPFFIGLYERARWGDGFGRTWRGEPDKNNAYDKGANIADWLRTEFKINPLL